MLVTFLISAVVILLIFGIGIYFWQKPSTENSDYILPPPPPDARSLFADAAAESGERLALAAAQEEKTAQLIERTRRGDRSALQDIHRNGDRQLYDRVLTELVQTADSDAKLLALMSHISQLKLPVNETLGRAVIESWKKSPDRNTTSKALHFAALSDNAELYRAAVDTALEFWRAGKLADISPAELQALFDGEFWILSPGTRSSGAGFVLKQSLADARRKLEAAQRATR